MPERTPLMFLGYNLGSYADFDGDCNSLTFYDWRPCLASDIRVKIPDADGKMLLMIGLEDDPTVYVEAYYPDRDPEHLVTVPWREFIGHVEKETV